MSEPNRQLALRVARNILIVNALLTVFKMLAGVMANSSAIVSDSAHSLSDMLSDIIVMAGVKLSAQKPDKKHPYGHERLECVAGVLLSFFLFSVGAAIGLSGLKKLLGGDLESLAVPGRLALIAAIVSLIANESMFWYARAAANKTGSVSLRAAAWHRRSDTLASAGSMIGILGSRLGVPALDPAACVVISALIVKVAVDIFTEAMDKMTDTACDDSLVDEIRNVALAHESVRRVDRIKTRLFGDKIYVDLEIAADSSSTLREAHGVAQHVHDDVESRFPRVKHCMVQVNPSDTDE